MHSKKLEDELDVGQWRSFGSFIEAERASDAARKRRKRGKTTAVFSMRAVGDEYHLIRVQ